MIISVTVDKSKISIHAPYAGSDSKSKQLSVIILLNIISFANSFANNKTISCIFAFKISKLSNNTSHSCANLPDILQQPVHRTIV